MFLYQGFFLKEGDRIKQEVLALDKKTLFSKTEISEIIDYDIVLFNDLINKILTGEVTINSQFNINSETIEREGTYLLNAIQKLNNKISLITFEILENGFKDRHYKTSDEFKSNLAQLGEAGAGLSLDDIPNFSSYIKNYEGVDIDQVKLDLAKTTYLCANPTKDEALSFGISLGGYCKDLKLNELIIEGIEDEKMLSIFSEVFEPLILKYNPNLEILYQGYYFEKPQNTIS